MYFNIILHCQIPKMAYKGWKCNLKSKMTKKRSLCSINVQAIPYNSETCCIPCMWLCQEGVVKRNLLTARWLSKERVSHNSVQLLAGFLQREAARARGNARRAPHSYFTYTLSSCISLVHSHSPMLCSTRTCVRVHTHTNTKYVLVFTPAGQFPRWPITPLPTCHVFPTSQSAPSSPVMCVLHYPTN